MSFPNLPPELSLDEKLADRSSFDGVLDIVEEIFEEPDGDIAKYLELDYATNQRLCHYAETLFAILDDKPSERFHFESPVRPLKLAQVTAASLGSSATLPPMNRTGDHVDPSDVSLIRQELIITVEMYYSQNPRINALTSGALDLYADTDYRNHDALFAPERYMAGIAFMQIEHLNALAYNAKIK